MVGDSRIVALASAPLGEPLIGDWAPPPSLGSPRGFAEILRHLNPAQAGLWGRQAGRCWGSINPVSAQWPPQPCWVILLCLFKENPVSLET